MLCQLGAGVLLQILLLRKMGVCVPSCTGIRAEQEGSFEFLFRKMSNNHISQCTSAGMCLSCAHFKSSVIPS